MEVNTAASSAPSTPHPPSELFIKWCETQVTANFILTFPADLHYSSFTSQFDGLLISASCTGGSNLYLPNYII